jgi:ATP-binding cassette subfamily F protein uup
VGGYVDWVRQRRTAEHPPEKASGGGVAVVASAPPEAAARASRKLSYKEQRELTDLPQRIAALESEQGTLQAAAAAPDFYREPADAIARTLDRVAEIEQELLQAYTRWDELDSRT